jgi:hypothetical protein
MYFELARLDEGGVARLEAGYVLISVRLPATDLLTSRGAARGLTVHGTGVSQD